MIAVRFEASTNNKETLFCACSFCGNELGIISKENGKVTRNDLDYMGGCDKCKSPFSVEFTDSDGILRRYP
jgi:hypothetical protein